MKPNNAETGTLLPGDTPVTAELHAAMWKLDAVREGSLLYSTRDVQNHVRTAIEILNRPAPLPDASLIERARDFHKKRHPDAINTIAQTESKLRFAAAFTSEIIAEMKERIAAELREIHLIGPCAGMKNNGHCFMCEYITKLTRDTSEGERGNGSRM